MEDDTSKEPRKGDIWVSYQEVVQRSLRKAHAVTNVLCRQKIISSAPIRCASAKNDASDQRKRQWWHRCEGNQECRGKWKCRGRGKVLVELRQGSLGRCRRCGALLLRQRGGVEVQLVVTVAGTDGPGQSSCSLTLETRWKSTHYSALSGKWRDDGRSNSRGMISPVHTSWVNKSRRAWHME